MDQDWGTLARRLWAARGLDADLDRDLAAASGMAVQPFTASVEAARALVSHTLPGWVLHLGYGASGVFPYAALAAGLIRVVSDAPTVPLAILRSLAGAKEAQARTAPPPA
jgi:hypothetical protein